MGCLQKPNEGSTLCCAMRHGVLSVFVGRALERVSYQ